MFGFKLDFESEFGKLQLRLDKQIREGLKEQGIAVVVRAVESMKPAGKTPEDPDYAHAPPGKPPYMHTGLLASSIAVGVEKGRVVVGPLSSVVGQRGAWLEFGGRPVQEGQTGKPRKRKLFPHPFMQPAMEAELHEFGRRIAASGSFTT
jgi:hypothetical protein